jgi:putative chitinase
MPVLTPELIKVIAPHARDDYVKSLTSDGGWMTLARYKITDKVDRLAGFLANCMHETGGLIILRESLNYKTPKRLREVWPSRFGSKSDAELLKLCGNEKALASVVYNGRMGNRPATDDGYIFRGAGYLQTTGREGFIKYGKLAGIDFSTEPPPSTDDASALLLMAAAEWAAGSCNELCEAGNFAGACAVINVGSASKISSVVGMDERQKWFKRITRNFAEYENILESPVPQAAPGGTGEAGTRPQLRRKASAPVSGEGHWYDGFTKWFKSSDDDAETPAVILHPELATEGDTARRLLTDSSPD